MCCINISLLRHERYRLMQISSVIDRQYKDFGLATLGILAFCPCLVNTVLSSASYSSRLQLFQLWQLTLWIMKWNLFFRYKLSISVLALLLSPMLNICRLLDWFTLHCTVTFSDTQIGSNTCTDVAASQVLTML